MPKPSGDDPAGLDWLQAVTIVCTLAAIALFFTGPRLGYYLALAVALATMLGRLAVVRRHPDAFMLTPRPHEAQAEIELPYATEHVWSFIYPAENAPLVSTSDSVRGYRVPGTPEGLGERQAFVDRRGVVEMIEVIEFVPGRKAVTVPVDQDGRVTSRLQIVYSLDPAPSGCRFSMVVRPAAGTKGYPALPSRRRLRRHLRAVATTLTTWDG